VIVATQSSGLAPAVFVSPCRLFELWPLTRYHLVTDVFRHSVADRLSTCRLRNIMLEVWSSKNFIHNTLVDPARCPHGTIFVLLFLAISEIPHRGIYVYVSWTGIEVVATFNVTFRQYREVRNPTNVWTALFLLGWLGRRLSNAANNGHCSTSSVSDNGLKIEVEM
jgi:hypothetical protein